MRLLLNLVYTRDARVPLTLEVALVRASVRVAKSDLSDLFASFLLAFNRSVTDTVRIKA